jgi:hypothetical protein
MCTVYNTVQYVQNRTVLARICKLPGECQATYNCLRWYVMALVGPNLRPLLTMYLLDMEHCT